MKTDRETEKTLLSKCLAGDRVAAETFVRQFSDPVYRFVQHILKTKRVFFNHHDLEDLHNTVFLHLFEDGCRRLRSFSGKNGCSLKTWLKIVTVRIVLNHLRKKGHDSLQWKKKQIPFESIYDYQSDPKDAFAMLEHFQQIEMIQNNINKLDHRDRLFLKLHFNQEMSISEVADILNISVNNAYTVKHRAIRRLKVTIESSCKN